MPEPIEVTCRIAGHELRVVARFIPRKNLWAVTGETDGEITDTDLAYRPRLAMECMLGAATRKLIGEAVRVD